MQKITCERCKKAWPKNPKGINEYRGHKLDCLPKIPQRPETVAVSKLPPRVPIEERGKEKREEVKKVETTKAVTEEPKPVKSEPIKLTYKYVGQCKCGQDVDTLSVELEKYCVIAFCNQCKKQLRHRKVAKL